TSVAASRADCSHLTLIHLMVTHLMVMHPILPDNTIDTDKNRTNDGPVASPFLLTTWIASSEVSDSAGDFAVIPSFAVLHLAVPRLQIKFLQVRHICCVTSSP